MFSFKDFTFKSSISLNLFWCQKDTTLFSYKWIIVTNSPLLKPQSKIKVSQHNHRSQLRDQLKINMSRSQPRPAELDSPGKQSGHLYLLRNIANDTYNQESLGNHQKKHVKVICIYKRPNGILFLNYYFSSFLQNPGYGNFQTSIFEVTAMQQLTGTLNTIWNLR